MQSNKCRASLTTLANPVLRHDYRVRWVGMLQDTTRLTVDMVPDRLILGPDAFAAYLSALAGGNWPTLEALVLTVLDDINNEMVPRWVRVAATRDGGIVLHQVTAEDRQPGWDNLTPEII
ncbi:MAG: hypothetical protein WCK65_02645 [Rhodospirillaceae bacterium]